MDKPNQDLPGKPIFPIGKPDLPGKPDQELPGKPEKPEPELPVKPDQELPETPNPKHKHEVNS